MCWIDETCFKLRHHANRRLGWKCRMRTRDGIEAFFRKMYAGSMKKFQMRIFEFHGFGLLRLQNLSSQMNKK
jgi:hypothetical protein